MQTEDEFGWAAYRDDLEAPSLSPSSTFAPSMVVENAPSLKSRFNLRLPRLFRGSYTWDDFHEDYNIFPSLMFSYTVLFAVNIGIISKFVTDDTVPGSHVGGQSSAPAFGFAIASTVTALYTLLHRVGRNCSLIPRTERGLEAIAACRLGLFTNFSIIIFESVQLGTLSCTPGDHECQFFGIPRVSTMWTAVGLSCLAMLAWLHLLRQNMLGAQSNITLLSVDDAQFL